MPTPATNWMIRVSALLVVAACRCPGREIEMKAFTGTRQPAVANQFYPGSQSKLEAMVDAYLDSAREQTDPGIRALIAPHAGYVYSGATAAEGYARLRTRKDIKRVVVIAPSHRCPFRGLSVGSYSKFRTPLGEIPVDIEACAALVEADDLFSQRNDAHAEEHALEVHLPFLQRALGAFKLVPVVCGFIDSKGARTAGRVLAANLWSDDTLWIISTDFTHYGDAFGYKPFSKDVETNLKQLDQGAIDRITGRDFDGFMKYIEETGATVCGRMPIAILLAALDVKAPKAQCKLLGYTTSGHMTHDFSHSVSYATVAVTEVDERRAQPAPADLPATDKKLLLNLARQAIRAGLSKEKLELPEGDDLSPILKDEGAAFVTLHLKGRLRGCIGNILPEEELYLNVVHNAVNAAFRDPRFRPLSEEEYEKIDIEISVLTRPRRIPSLDEFEIGRHGIILSKRGRRAVFLPQVAPEQGWDVETTMTHLSLKAGLGADDWKRDATYEVFEAVVFHE